MLSDRAARLVCIIVCTVITLLSFFTLDMTSIFLGIPVFSGISTGYVVLSIFLLFVFILIKSTNLRLLIGASSIMALILVRTATEAIYIYEYLEQIFGDHLVSMQLGAFFLYGLGSLAICMVPLAISVYSLRACR